jgi:integrase
MKKKEAKFILNKPKSDSLTHIFLKFTCSDSPLVYSTQQMIHPKEWNPDTQRCLVNKKINSELYRLHGIVEQYIESCRILGKRVLKLELKDELDSKSNRSAGSGKSNQDAFFFISITKIIADAEKGKGAKKGEEILTPDGKEYSKGTLKNWKSTINLLRDFDKDLSYSTISLQTYTSFITFCNKRKFSLNYTDRFIKDWKTLLRIAKLRGLHNNLIYLDERFKRVNEESPQVYLDDKEIRILYDFNIIDSNIKTQRMRTVIRDRFIINLYNGLRVSDMYTLDEENIFEDLITHTNQKTSKKVAMPVHPVVKEIMKKYEGLPYQYHEAVVNREIKKIAKAAGITKIERYTKTIGGETIHFAEPKWKLITNHTARRSMTTNLLKHTDIISAMSVVGMSLKTLEKYNKRSVEENAEMLKSNPFFKK